MAKAVDKLNNIIIAISAAGAVAGVYAFYKANWWRPTVQVNAVDYKTGEADVTVNGKQQKLYGNGTLAAGGSWGLRFNSDKPGGPYNRIELVKDDMYYTVYK